MKLKVLLQSIRQSNKGPELIVSRADKLLIRRLFEIEVPEIFNGTVEIVAIAREPGWRSKVGVFAKQDGVDAVGSCVGLNVGVWVGCEVGVCVGLVVGVALGVCVGVVVGPRVGCDRFFLYVAP